MILPKPKATEKILLIAFMFLPLLAIGVNLDNDIWFLLNHGRYIVENGFPVIEPFSIHENFEFIVQQWLFSVIVHYAYTLMGKWGIMLVVYASAVVVTILLYKITMLLSSEKFYLSVLLTTVISLLFCMYYMVSRPQIITYIIILTAFYLLEKYVVTDNAKWLWFLPVLSLLLINFHSSMWWLLFAFFIPYLISSFRINKWNINTEPIRKAPLFITGIFMLVAGFINPYGYKAIAYVFSSFGDETISCAIIEMAVPDVKDVTGFIFFLTFALGVLSYVFNREGKSTLRFFLLSIGTTFLALMSIKGMAYYLIGALLPLAFWFKNLAHKLTFTNSKKELGLTTLFIVFVVAVSVWAHVNDYDPSKDFPQTKAAVEYLAENEDPTSVKLYTSFQDGGYVEHCGFKAYIDARAEVFIKANNKKEDVFGEYVSLQSGVIHYADFLEKYQFSHIIVTSEDVLDVYLAKDKNYAVYYEDDNSRIYVPITKE